MKKPWLTGILLGFPLLFISCTRCSLDSISIGSKNGKEVGTISVMSYNVENFFDDVDNGTEYRDYDPGEGEWSADLFHAKMLNISEVIGTSVPKGPDIIALQEIENKNALETLQREGVKNLGYAYSAVVEAPEAAVNTAVLSRFPITEVRSHRLHMKESEKLRNILEVVIEINEKRLYIFNNHWKSKAGGAEETEPLRIAAAGLLSRRVTAILRENPDADVLLCGDFNENHDEVLRIDYAYPTALTLLGDETDARGGIVITGDKERAAASADDALVFFSPWFEADSSGAERGSYVYKREWETIDQFLLSPGLFDDEGFSYGDFTVAREDFMVTEEGFPLRWNKEYEKGYSDHLPIILTLRLD